MEIIIETKHSKRTTYLVLGLALAIIGLWTWYTQPGVLGKADAVGYAICHRIDERSFIAFGRPLPLCARCTGIYLGVMTGLSVFVASGRSRAGYLPHWKLWIPLSLFVMVLGIDGLNSYLTLFPNYEGVYQPQNWLRLTTGVFTGITLITLVYPIFNQSIWEDAGDRVSPIKNFKELAGLLGLAILVVLIMLTENATILVFLGVVSAIGVVTVLTMIMSVMVVTVLQTFRTYTTWRELWLPLLAGLTLAIMMIGTIDFLRYTATGTWSGFSF